MGGVTSKFDETDWSRANGGLLAHWEDTSDLRAIRDVTIDGMAPTYKFSLIEIIKTSVSQREFQVIDPRNKNLLYITKSVPGTLAWFDVLGPNSIGDEYRDLKLRVQTDLRRRTWMVYRYNKPVFEGQRPATLTVRKGLKDSDQLYKTACITVSWSRYAAVAIRYGPPSLDDVLEIEEGARLEDGDDDEDDDEEENWDNVNDLASPKNDNANGLDTSYEENDNNNNNNIGDGDEHDQDEDDLEDIMAQAAKIAASRRNLSVETILPSDKSSASTTPSKKSSSTRPKRGLKKALSSCSPCHNATNDSPESSFRRPSSFDKNNDDDDEDLLVRGLSKRHLGLEDYKKKISAASSSTPSTTTSSSSSAKLKELWKSKSKSIGSRIFSDQQDGDQQQPPNKPLTKSERKEQRRQKALEQAMEGIIDLGTEPDINNPDDESPGAAVQCREIYNKLIGTHQTSWISREEVLELLRMEEEGGEQQQTGKNNNNNKNNKNGTSSSNNNTSGPQSPKATTTKSNGDAPTSPQWQSMSGDDRKRNSWFGFGLLQKPGAAAAAAAEGAAADSTTKTTSTEGEEAKKEPGSSAAVENAGGLQSLLEGDSPTSPSAKKDDDFDDDLDAFKPIEDIMPVGLRALLDNDDYVATSPRTEGENNNNNNNKKQKDKEPLIGYWTWKNTYKVHKMRMHLARNSDLALHVVFAILVNQVRYERNAIAMTV